MEINIKNKLYNDIKSYCEINNINDVEKEINSILLKSFTILKYGTSPYERVKMEELKKQLKRGRPKKVVETPSKLDVDKKELEEAKESVLIKEETEVKPKTRKIRVIKNE